MLLANTVILFDFNLVEVSHEDELRIFDRVLKKKTRRFH